MGADIAEDAIVDFPKPFERIEREVIETRSPNIAKAAMDDPETRAWFGDGALKDAEGRPQVFYHGTLDAFDDFDRAKRGSSTDAPDAMGGVFLSSSPDMASSYAKADVAPYQGGITGFVNKVTGGGYERLNEAVLNVAGKTSYPDTAGNVRPTIANVRNPRRIVMRGDEYDPVAMADHIRAAKEAGHDALLIKGMRDDFEGTGEKGDVLVVFDEGNLRSAFDRRPFSETEAAATGNTIPLNVDKVNAPEVQRAIHAGRELDAKLNELPTGAAWVDSPSERAAVMGHQTEALRDVVEADGAFGPILRQFQGRPKEAIEELRRLQSGDAIGALHHPHTGPVDL